MWFVLFWYWLDRQCICNTYILACNITFNRPESIEEFINFWLECCVDEIDLDFIRSHILIMGLLLKVNFRLSPFFSGLLILIFMCLNYLLLWIGEVAWDWEGGFAYSNVCWRLVDGIVAWTAAGLAGGRLCRTTCLVGDGLNGGFFVTPTFSVLSRIIYKSYEQRWVPGVHAVANFR